MSDTDTRTDNGLGNEVTGRAEAPDPEVLGAEPDNPPVRFLAFIGVGLTIGVLIALAFVYGLFRYEMKAQLRAKGYSVDASAPSWLQQDKKISAGPSPAPRSAAGEPAVAPVDGAKSTQE